MGSLALGQRDGRLLLEAFYMKIKTTAV